MFQNRHMAKDSNQDAGVLVARHGGSCTNRVRRLYPTLHNEMQILAKREKKKKGSSSRPICSRDQI